ncbi:MAG: hypothetical protein COR54_03205, partial [Elusimicrobia bacterium CG22_combo_CG10-13_8_21_14_all_63_91]
MVLALGLAPLEFISMGEDVVFVALPFDDRVLNAPPRRPSCGRDIVGSRAQVGFWCVDKYEASVWNSASCTGTQYGVNGAGDDNYPAACN